jgi:transposase-like protein
MAIITQPYFWDEQAAHAKLERLVWPNGPVCPHCGARERIGAVTGKGARTALKFCCHCRKQFRATMGTMFEGSHVPLHKWFQACFLLTATHKGISPHQLHLRLEVTNKTALAMVHRIEEARRSIENDGSAEGSPDAVRRRVRWRAGGPASGPREEQAGPFETGAGEQEVPWAKTPSGPPRQFLAFVEVARDLGHAEDSGAFDKTLAQIACYQPPDLTRRRYAAADDVPPGSIVAAPSETRTRRFG